MTFFLVAMHWVPDCLWHGPRQNGLLLPALYFTPSTPVTRVSVRKHSHSMFIRPTKQPLSKYCLWHVYKHPEVCQESHCFQTFARSSHSSILRPCHYYHRFFTRLSSQLRIWLSSLISYTQAVNIYNSNSIHPSFITCQADPVLSVCKEFIKFGCYNFLRWDYFYSGLQLWKQGLEKQPPKPHKHRVAELEFGSSILQHQTVLYSSLWNIKKHMFLSFMRYCEIPKTLSQAYHLILQIDQKTRQDMSYPSSHRSGHYSQNLPGLLKATRVWAWDSDLLTLFTHYGNMIYISINIRLFPQSSVSSFEMTNVWNG